MKASHTLKALLTAALALPGLRPDGVLAQTEGEGAASLKYLDYFDYQKGADRMRIRAPQLWFSAPLGEDTTLEGSGVIDSVSGASPRAPDTLSGASGIGIHERRRAGDLRLTRRFGSLRLGAGLVYSGENDYESQALSLEAKLDSDDRNTTWTVGLGLTSDRIGSTNDPFLHERRHGVDYFFGVTRVLSPVSILQTNLAYSDAEGYLSDPYKSADERPRQRRQWAWLTRYNHFFPDLDGSLHADYRYYRNDWGVRAHTVEAAWYQSLGGAALAGGGSQWTLRPSVRYHSQSAADFYSTELPTFDAGEYYSSDARLASFGGLTLGVKLIRELSHAYAVDLSYEQYRQSAALKAGGDGTTGFEPLRARIFLLGLRRRF